jgi:hypothetical protein
MFGSRMMNMINELYGTHLAHVYLKKGAAAISRLYNYGPIFLLPYQSKNLYQHNRNRRKVYILIGTNKLSQIKVEVLYTSVI